MNKGDYLEIKAFLGRSLNLEDDGIWVRDHGEVCQHNN